MRTIASSSRRIHPAVTYGIQSHPARDAGALRVAEQLGRDVAVFSDTENRGPWNSARKLWEATPRRSSWRVLLQDDVDLATDFADVLEDLLEREGGARGRLHGRPLALYNGLTNRYAHEDQAHAGDQWIERRDGLQGPVIVLQTVDVFPMLEWCERFVRDGPAMTSSDIRPSLWLEAMRRHSLAPVPSWVQHRGHEPSLIGTKATKSQPRTSPTFTPGPIGGIDWTRGLERPAVHGVEYGASRRVRWHLWRTWQHEPDHVLDRLGLDPREGMPYFRGGLASPAAR